MIDFENVPKHLATRTHEAMKPVLMNPNAVGPAIHYYMIRGGSKQKNVTIWEPGTVGGEYIKAFGHYHVDDLPETYWIRNGEGIVLLQKLESDEAGNLIPDRVSEFRVILVKEGDTVHIPERYGHLVANTSDTFLTTVDDSPVDFGDADPSGHPGHAEYSLVEKMHGFAYYVVKHLGKPALIRNTKYVHIELQELAGLVVLENL